MSTLDEYAAFLTARWDEIEAVAAAAGHGCGYLHEHNGGWVEVQLPSEHNVRPGYEMRHIRLHAPKAVLTDLAAKRAVLVSALSCAKVAEEKPDDLAMGLVSGGMARGMFEAVKHLAAPFRDHPDHPESAS